MAARQPLIDQLCLSCGLCCNGVLFRDVELQPGDDAARYRSAGLAVESLKTKVRFPQPCGVLCADNRCRLYADRPTRCREFECGQLQAVAAGRRELTTALKTVQRARRLSERVLKLLRVLGDQDEHLPLSRRFQRTTRRLERGLADENAAADYGDLTLAVHELNHLLHSEFHVPQS